MVTGLNKRLLAAAGKGLLSFVLLLTAVFPSLSNEAAADGAIQLQGSVSLSDRLSELTIQSSALAAPTKVRILLPAGYDANPTKRYPVLYLLHGCCDPAGEGYTSWTKWMNAEALTASYDMIVVMPYGGEGGFYSDWYNNGSYGQPQWETYHIGQLLPWIDSHYRTIANRSGRAIAGVSMGGFGAISYAARHPDLFAATAAFSGYLDNLSNPDLATIAAGVDGGGPASIWGLRQTQEVRWRGHNPIDLAENLRGMTVVLRTGNGQSDLGLDPIEQQCWQASTALHLKLQSLGIAHVWDDYGPGTHTPPFAERDLALTLPIFQQVFDQAVQPPTAFPYKTIEPAYGVFGWSVQLTRPALEFSRFEATNGGFKLEGSGSATVKTPPVYVVGRQYRVTINGPFHNQTLTLTAGIDKRLSVLVVLGPGNPFQQYSPDQSIYPSGFYTANVTITAV